MNHRVDIGDSPPICKAPYRVPFRQQPTMKPQIDEWLSYALTAYASMTHSSTGESPFFLMYGRDMDYPYDDIFKPLRVRYDTDSNYVSEFLQRMKLAHRNTIEQMERSTERVHNIFNRKTNAPAFQVGDLVYLHDPATKVGINRKLAMKWTTVSHH